MANTYTDDVGESRVWGWGGAVSAGYCLVIVFWWDPVIYRVDVSRTRSLAWFGPLVLGSPRKGGSRSIYCEALRASFLEMVLSLSLRVGYRA